MRDPLGTLALLALSAVACREHRGDPPAKATPALPGRIALASDAGNRAEWPMATGDHRNLRFSQLAQISGANVRDLKAVWRFPLPRRAWRALSHPLIVLLLQALVIWLWHIPAWFQAALANEWLHAVQHAMFFGVASLF